MLQITFLCFVWIVIVNGDSGYFVPTVHYYNESQYNKDLMVVLYDKDCINTNYSANGRAVDKLLLSAYSCIEPTGIHLELIKFEISVFNISDNSCVQNRTINYDEFCINRLEYDIFITDDIFSGKYNNNFYCSDRDLDNLDVGSTSQLWNLEFLDGNQYYWDSVGADGCSNDKTYRYPILDTVSDESNIDIYVTDTGIYINHQELSYAQQNYEWIQWGNEVEVQPGPVAYHGTFVTAIIIGKNVGVADINDFKLYNLNMRGISSGIWALMQQLMDHLQARPTKRGIINASWGWCMSEGSQEVWDDMFLTIKSLGGIFVAAAGNKGEDSCNQCKNNLNKKFYPAASEYVIGVGTFNKNGEVNTDHNYGECIDFFGPGMDIFSTYLDNDAANWPNNVDDYQLGWGTSFAAPHIAGIIANILMQQPEYVRLGASNENIIDYLRSPGKYFLLNNCPQNHCYAPLSRCDYSDFESFFHGIDTDLYVDMHRYYKTGVDYAFDHFYSTELVQNDYTYERVEARLISNPTKRIEQGYSGSAVLVPFYRYWNPIEWDHFYTTSWSGPSGIECSYDTNWYYERIVGYCWSSSDIDEDVVPLYRYWNPIIWDHFYTTDSSEIGTTTGGISGNGGYEFEGITCYVNPVNNSDEYNIDAITPAPVPNDSAAAWYSLYLTYLWMVVQLITK